MRLISFSNSDVDSFGVITEAGIVDVGARLGRDRRGLMDLLLPDGLAQIAKIRDTGKVDFAPSDVTLQRPIPYPEKIVCIGVNYGNRNAEYKDGSDQPKYPSVFMRTPDSFVAHGAPILRPPESQQLDYEGEIAVVIGKPGRRIEQARAWDHVAGLTCLNEGTIRDWVRHGKFNVTPGKNFQASGAIGPWLVTADEISDFADLTVTTRVNGEMRQHDATTNLLFPLPYLINYLSTFMPLKPGDVIATGTPTGSGARFDPPRYLTPGDVVEVEVPRVGLLRNVVEDEA